MQKQADFFGAGSKLAAGLLTLWSFTAAPALAWGPHSQITQAALDVLGTNHAFVRHLGAQAPRLTNYCWLPDYFGVVFEEPGELFYADDYLLFPGAPAYIDHTGSDIRQAFRPFYQRAVQALHTENPANAARWIGALAHFVQDAACPPHAAGLRGEVHANMENWVDATHIRIPGYQPITLGLTVDDAWDNLLRRVNELMAQAEERGRRLRVAVEIGNRGAVGPVVLESALASARITADLLHTLGQLPSPAPHRTGLRGIIASATPPGLERFPAKVMLAGTPYSALTDAAGNFQWHSLPPGQYTLIACRPGNIATQAQVTVVANQTNFCQLALLRGDGNLVPNGEFTRKWVRSQAADYWTQTKSGWENLPIPLKAGQKYRLLANYRPGAKASVLVRLTRAYEHAVPRYKIEPRFETRTLTPANPSLDLTGSSSTGLLHLTLRGRTPPASVLESIRLVPVPENK